MFIVYRNINMDFETLKEHVGCVQNIKNNM